jgi:hypothetical protein
VQLDFTGELWFWKGPAPWHFITVPEDGSGAIDDVSDIASYGWGCIPVKARIGDTDWKTSLIPKNGRYLVPVKTAVRKAEGLELGDSAAVRLTIDI